MQRTTTSSDNADKRLGAGQRQKDKDVFSSIKGQIDPVIVRFKADFKARFGKDATAEDYATWLEDQRKFQQSLERRNSASVQTDSSNAQLSKGLGLDGVDFGSLKRK
jgi:hypothetical protein